jgi:hypothetical protein
VDVRKYKGGVIDIDADSTQEYPVKFTAELEGDWLLLAGANYSGDVNQVTDEPAPFLILLLLSSGRFVSVFSDATFEGPLLKQMNWGTLMREKFGAQSMLVFC